MEPSHLHELKQHGFTHYDNIETALRKFFAASKLRRLELEQIPLREAANRVLGKDVSARNSLPLQDRSLVDGYALRTIDTRGSGRKNPARLRLLAEIKLGEVASLQIARKECARVLTGGFLPQGADAVIMFEEAEASKNQIKILRPVRGGENLVRAGVDVREGALLFRRGQTLHWFEIGLLAALNEDTVSVVRRPRVAVLSTGDELSEPGGRGTPDSNRYGLLSALSSCGAEPIDLGIASDNLKEILSKLRSGLKKADMIIVSGGSSVGKRDLVPEAVSSLGKPGLIVHGVAMRPGSPTGLGAVGGKPILILPGLPVSALIGFYILGQRILAKMSGASGDSLTLSVVKGRVMEDIEAQKGMTSFRPVRVEEKGDSFQVYPVKPYGSSIISSMAKADGLIRLESDAGRIASGAEVRVYLLRSIARRSIQ